MVQCGMKQILVLFILTYLKLWAKIALLVKRPVIIGITGSAGKTSARDTIYALLKDRFKTYVIQKGNSETGVPLGILGLQVHSLGFDSIHKSIKDWAMLLVRAPLQIGFPGQFDYMIIEMGIDSPEPPKNMSYLLSIVQPDIAIVLNAYATHSEQFEHKIRGHITHEKITSAIAEEKVKLITHNSQCKLAIYNKDNEYISQFLDEINIEHVIFGESPDNHISYLDHVVTPEKTLFTFRTAEKRPLTLTISGYILPQAFREAFASAILVGQYVGMDISDIQSALEKNFTLEPGRSTVLKGINDSLIIDSSYNASGEAVATMLQMVGALKEQTRRPFVFLFGDMRELGKSAESEHLRVAGMLPGMVDYLYTVGPLTEKYVYTHLKTNKAFKDIQAFAHAHEAGKYLKDHLPHNALVLVKGSQNTIFLEEAIKFILEDSQDSSKLARQEDYWIRKKHFPTQ